MQEIQNVGHPNFIPGDIVRSNDDNNDYVIHTITQTTGDILLITGIALFTYKLKKWHDSKSITFQSQVRRIMLNKKGQTPKEILNEVTRFIDTVTNGDKSVFDVMLNPENRILRDMLYFAKEADTHGLRKEFIDIANSLMFLTGEPINEQELTSVLMEVIGSGKIDPEFVQDVVKRIKNGSTFVAPKAALKIKSDAYKKMLTDVLKPKVAGNGETSNFARGMKLGLFKPLGSRNVGRMADMSNHERELFDSYLLNRQNPLFTGQGAEASVTVEQRMGQLIRNLFPNSEGSDMDALVDILLPETMTAFKRGKKNSVIKKMLEAYNNDPVQGKDVMQWVEDMQSASQRVEHPYSWMPWQTVKQNIGPRYDSLANVRRRVDIDQLASSSNTTIEARDRLLSIDRPTFFDQVLEGTSKVKMNGKTLDLSIGADHAQVMEAVRDRISFIMTPQTLNTVRTRAKEGKAIDLTWLFGVDTAARRGVDESAILELESQHAARKLNGDITFRGARVIEMRLQEQVVERARNVASQGLEKDLVRHGILDEVAPVVGEQGDNTATKRIFAMMGENEKIYAAQSIKEVEELMKREKIAPSELWDSFKFVDTPTTVLDNARVLAAADFKAINQKFENVVTSENLVNNYDIDFRTSEGLKRFLKERGLTAKTRGSRRSVRMFRGVPFVGESKESAFLSGQMEGHLALANFKSDGSLRMISSEAKIGLRRQADMFKDFYNNGGIVLDIENYANSNHIHQFSYLKTQDGQIGKTVNHYFTQTGAKGGQALADADYEQAFIKVIEQFRKDMRGEKILVTHGETDVNKMIETIRSFQTIDPKTKNNLIKSLKYMVTTKNIDVETVAQIAGEKKVSQQHLMFTVLGSTENHPHDALEDNITATNIMQKLKDRFFQNEKDMTLIQDADLVEQQNLIFGDLQPYSTSRGRIRRLVNVASNRKGKVYNTIFEDMVPHLVTDTEGRTTVNYVPTGSYHVEEFSNTRMLRASLNNAVQLTPESVDEIKKITEARSDMWERQVRAFTNPTELSVIDKLHMWQGQDPTRVGPLAPHDLIAKKEAMSLYEQAQKEFLERTNPSNVKHEYVREIVSRFSGEDIPDLRDRHIVARQVADAVGVNHGERTRRQLELMLQDNMEATSIMSSSSPIHKFLNSNVGETLYHLAKEDSESQGALYTVFAHTFNKVYADKMEGHLPLVDMGPRLGLDFMGHGVTRSVKTLSDIDKLGDAASALAGNTLLKLHPSWDSNTDAIRSFVGNDLGLSIDRIQSELGGLMKTRVSLDDFKGILTDLMHGDPTNKQTGYLSNVVKKMVGSEQMANSFRSALTAKIDASEDHIKATGTKLLEDIERRTTNGHTFVEAMQIELKERLKAHGSTELPPELATLFQDLRTPDLTEHFLETFQSEAAQKEVKELTHVVEVLGGRTKVLNEVLEKAVAAQRLAFDEGQEGLALRGAFGRAFHEEAKEVLHKQGINYAEVLAGNADTSYLRRIQQNAVNEATVIASKVGAMGEDAVKAAHTALTKDVAKAYKIDALKGAIVPLMFLAGMAAQSPIEDDHFTEGKQSEQSPSQISRYAEIPGSHGGQPNVVWHDGDTNPFRLDITFTGFVKTKEEHDALMSSVYDAISGNINTEKVTSRTRDLRKDRTIQNAKDLMVV